MNEVIRESILDMIYENDDFKKSIKYIFDVYISNGYELYLVGGAVRDILSNKSPKDYDFSTNAPIDVTMSLFDKVIPTGLQHGTVTVVINNISFEVTIFRKDVESDGRHSTIEAAKSIEDDLSRRDFTCNAIAMTFDGEIFDPFNGAEDLANGVVKFVGNPIDRMQEDYLRMLRYFRFHGRIGGNEYDQDTCNAIKQCASGLNQISGERIWNEMGKILSGKNAGDVLYKMYELGVAQVLGLPVSSAARSQQVNDLCQKVNTPITILAFLLDDIITAQTLHKRWKFSSPEFKLLYWIVGNKGHLFTLETAQDYVVDGVAKEWVRELAILKHQQSIGNQIMNWVAPEFPVNGDDLAALGIKPGQQMGQLLKAMKNSWKQSRFTLTKEDLLEQI